MGAHALGCGEVVEELGAGQVAKTRVVVAMVKVVVVMVVVMVVMVVMVKVVVMVVVMVGGLLSIF